MKDSQKPDHVSLASMVSRLREGRYVIPDFQRDFEWEPWDINELMRSIFRDYYIGSLLLWKGKKENFDALSCEPIYAFEGGDGRTDIVLDRPAAPHSHVLRVHGARQTCPRTPQPISLLHQSRPLHGGGI